MFADVVRISVDLLDAGVKSRGPAFQGESRPGEPGAGSGWVSVAIEPLRGRRQTDDAGDDRPD